MVANISVYFDLIITEAASKNENQLTVGGIVSYNGGPLQISNATIVMITNLAVQSKINCGALVGKVDNRVSFENISVSYSHIFSTT